MQQTNLDKVKTRSVELICNIYGWGVDRNITLAGGASISSQFLKGAQEVVETAIGYGRKDSKEVSDGVGDILTCLIQAHRIGGGSRGGMYDLINDAVFTCEINNKFVSAGKSLELLAEAVARNSITLSLKHLVQFIQVAKLQVGPSVATWEYIEAALAQAWYEIKDRKGTMINGQFVKEQ